MSPNLTKEGWQIQPDTIINNYILLSQIHANLCNFRKYSDSSQNYAVCNTNILEYLNFLSLYKYYMIIFGSSLYFYICNIRTFHEISFLFSLFPQVYKMATACLGSPSSPGPRSFLCIGTIHICLCGRGPGLALYAVYIYSAFISSHLRDKMKKGQDKCLILCTPNL